jgi:hypothetical protein
MERSCASVVSGILPDVEGGILPPGMAANANGAPKHSPASAKSNGFLRRAEMPGSTAGRDANRCQFKRGSFDLSEFLKLISISF